LQLRSFFELPELQTFAKQFCVDWPDSPTFAEQFCKDSPDSQTASSSIRSFGSICLTHPGECSHKYRASGHCLIEIQPKP
jgi:hypothetical protein